jgi:arylsulfatase A-like enzyme
MSIGNWITALILGVVLCGAVTVSAADTPNVIFMLTDDLGYSDIGCYGAKTIETPHIDKLAAEGIRFTDFSSGANICSPSRAAFLTGAYPQRAGLYMGINPIRTPHWFIGLNPDEVTLPEQFRTKAYSTHMVGKWHLGTEPEFHPTKHGFDTYYGMPCNFSHSPKFFDGDKEVFARTPIERLTELYTERMVKLIKDSGDSPFFIYYAHNYPHTPYKAGKRFAGSSKDGVRGDIMQEMDWGVGEVMQALQEAGKGDNTIFIFTSDNGPTSNKYAKPFRGTKYVTFEGGHRVPFIMHWPAKIKPGQMSETRANAMDLFPTLSEIVGAPLPKDRVYDGVSLLPILNGDRLNRPATQPFFYYNCENLQAVRVGDWKLHLPREAKQLPFWDKNKAFANLQKPVLYNLAKDPAESTNLAATEPERVQEMVKLAETTRQRLGEFMQRGDEQRATGSAVPDAPIISHDKDWGQIQESERQRIHAERLKRYPNFKGKTKKTRKKK